ncbi:MAG: DUF1080 domain-containing protein [Bacteroidota bacterium]|nr:DUF1080 domain-containing protein [Bacteroidota bacterium]
MKKEFFLVCFIAASFAFSIKKHDTPYQNPHHKWTYLFNGKDLHHWDTYLGPEYDSLSNQFTGTPLGLNNDPHHVFSVINLDGEKVLAISGQDFGGIISKDNFKNFHLQMKFKWGTKTWATKKGKKKDSGLLYYSVGKLGADFGFWMRSQEFQIEQGNVGDYWGVAGGAETVATRKVNDSTFIYDPQGTYRDFYEKSTFGRRCIKTSDNEKPDGQWNTIDLFCFNGKSIHMVNGKVLMVLGKSQQLDSGGKLISLDEGKIQIQSEGAQIYYKDIRIEPIDYFPKGY